MPSKEIKLLKEAGKIDEAYEMAHREFVAEPENIWAKRNLSWVLYAQMNACDSDLTEFLSKLNEVKQLNLPSDELMFFDNLSIVIAKTARVLLKEVNIDYQKIHKLFDAIKELPLVKKSKWYSVLYSAMHKGMKESYRYIEFADWWDFENFTPEDYQKEKLPNGKEVMSIVEQAYITYAKNLLPKFNTTFDKEKAELFIQKLDILTEQHPEYQYPAYFQAKLLKALGDKDNMLEKLLPFAKKKRNDFWVWEILTEAFLDDEDKVFACYCRALSCHSPEEMLVNLRQKMAGLLIKRKLYNEAKTEIDQLVLSKIKNGFKISEEVIKWKTQDWYLNAKAFGSNRDFYIQYISIAESILFMDIPEELVFIDFVNSDKKIANFIASETKIGFFKYERFIQGVKTGDVLKVRFQGGANESMYQIYTAVRVYDEHFLKQFMKEVSGLVRITAGKPFGFIEDVFIHPSLVTKYKLTDGMQFTGKAIKSFNQEKKQWGWKVI